MAPFAAEATMAVCIGSTLSKSAVLGAISLNPIRSTTARPYASITIPNFFHWIPPMSIMQMLTTISRSVLVSPLVTRHAANTSTTTADVTTPLLLTPPGVCVLP
jgi:hypothetical protein